MNVSEPQKISIQNNLLAAREKLSRLRAEGKVRKSWSQEEIDKVAYAVASRMFKQGLIEIPQPRDMIGCSLVKGFCKQAQDEVLSPERRNPNFSTTHLKKARLKKALRRAFKTLGAEKKAEFNTIPLPATVAPPPEEKKDVVIEPSLEDLLRLIFQKLDIKTQSEDTAALEELVSGEFTKLNGRIEELNARILSLEGKQQSPEIIRIKKTPVAICGCQQREFAILTAKVQDLPIELRLYEQNKNFRDIHAEWAIYFQWSDHGWTDKLKQSGMANEKMAKARSISQATAQLMAWFGE